MVTRGSPGACTLLSKYVNIDLAVCRVCALRTVAENKKKMAKKGWYKFIRFIAL